MAADNEHYSSAVRINLRSREDNDSGQIENEKQTGKIVVLRKPRRKRSSSDTDPPLTPTMTAEDNPHKSTFDNYNAPRPASFAGNITRTGPRDCDNHRYSIEDGCKEVDKRPTVIKNDACLEPRFERNRDLDLTSNSNCAAGDVAFLRQKTAAVDPSASIFPASAIERNRNLDESPVATASGDICCVRDTANPTIGSLGSELAKTPGDLFGNGRNGRRSGEPILRDNGEPAVRENREPVLRRRRADLQPMADDGPDAELSRVLKRRSKYLEDFETELSQKGVAESERQIDAFEKRLEREKAEKIDQQSASEPIIIDEQLLNILRSRQEVVDAAVEGLPSNDSSRDRDDVPSLKKVDKLVLEDEKLLQEPPKITTEAERLDIDKDEEIPMIAEAEKIDCIDEEPVKIIIKADVIDRDEEEPSKIAEVEQVVDVIDKGQEGDFSLTGVGVREYGKDSVCISSTAIDSVVIIDGRDSLDSTDCKDALPKTKGILKSHDDHASVPVKGILKRRDSGERRRVRGILKTNVVPIENDPNNAIHGILKRVDCGENLQLHTEDKKGHLGILKKETGSLITPSPLRGVLKKDNLESCRGGQRRGVSDDEMAMSSDEDRVALTALCVEDEATVAGAERRVGDEEARVAEAGHGAKDKEAMVAGAGCVVGDEETTVAGAGHGIGDQETTVAEAGHDIGDEEAMVAGVVRGIGDEETIVAGAGGGIGDEETTVAEVEHGSKDEDATVIGEEHGTKEEKKETFTGVEDGVKTEEETVAGTKCESAVAGVELGIEDEATVAGAESTPEIFENDLGGRNYVEAEDEVEVGEDRNEEEDEVKVGEDWNEEEDEMMSGVRRNADIDGNKTDSENEDPTAMDSLKVAPSVRHSRCITEPTTRQEKQELASDVNVLPVKKVEDLKPGLSLSERMNALHKSGETWRNRVEHDPSLFRQDNAKNSEEEVRVKTKVSDVGVATIIETPVVVTRRDKTARSCVGAAARPVSIADRMTLLQGSQETWKRKVGEKDAAAFTVEEKMSRYGTIGDSPLSAKPKRPVTVQAISPTKPESKSQQIESDTSSISPPPPSVKIEVPVEEVPVTVEVPVIDEMAEFFGTHSTEKILETKLNVTVDDFDVLFLNSSDILTTVRKVKPNRTKAGSRNPLKTMSQLISVQHEYTEVKSGIAEKELNRMKRERVIGTPGLAQEALAGLASQENFSRVSLRKSGTFTGTGIGEKYPPFIETMLLHIKGRKWCQTRLVEPSPKSINKGDSFILKTLDVVYVFSGQFSNVIERSKAADLANQICQKHDLGVKPACKLVTIDEEKATMVSRELRKFWESLGSNEICIAQEPGNSEEDDLYELYVNDTNAVYVCNDDGKLVKMSEYDGKLLSHKMLQSTEIYIFDFGSEMYVWTGKKAPFTKRQEMVKLANVLWQKGYDYADYNINPLCPLVLEEKGGLPVRGEARPPWALFGKVNENMETVLFKEKFTDWPDPSRLIKVKGQSSDRESKTEHISDLKPCNVKKMIEVDRAPVSMILEGSHVGRGNVWEEIQDGIKWEYEIRTEETDVWHVTEFTHKKLEKKSYGQFYDGDTYVVRWRYSIHQIARTLKGDESRQALTGRVRCAYFFWQGRHSSINEKGASALMTVELDKENGPQVQIIQGKEPPPFVNLFRGEMVVHAGKFSGENRDFTRTWKLFIVLNELANELNLLEIPVSSKNLRSRTSFLLLNVETGRLFVWHGAKCSRDVQQGIRELVNKLKQRCPKEFDVAENKSLTVIELNEGTETKEFWDSLGMRCLRASYNSLLDDRRSFDHSLRLFYMTSISGSFDFSEIICPMRNDDSAISSSYPFLQSDFYNSTQPALFILDNHHEVYVWQGWWPTQMVDTDNVQTGSAETRFNVNRKCAMETALKYTSELCPTNPRPVFLVYAGCEPIEFTSLFPFWETDDAVKTSATKAGQIPGSKDSVENILAKLTRNQYTFVELQERPLPDGVDPLKLETYLSDEEFFEVVKMDHKEFLLLPIWKQTKMKQLVGLF